MSQPPQVPVTDVPDRLAQGAVLIDVREPNETSVGHAPQAHLNPMQQFDLAAVPADTPLLVICRSGARSNNVAQALMERGFDASNVAGGMLAWFAAGLPVVDASGQPGFILE